MPTTNTPAKQYERGIVPVWEDPYFVDYDTDEQWRKDAVDMMYEYGVEPADVFDYERDPNDPFTLITRSRYSEEQINDYIQDCIYSQLEAEEKNLDKNLPQKIYAFGVSELWDRTILGVSPLDSYNLAKCFDFSLNGDYYSYYVEGEDFKVKAVHHDGTNHATFRMINPELSDEEKEEFIELLEYGECGAAYDMTVPIGDYIREIYGTW